MNVENSIQMLKVEKDEKKISAQKNTNTTNNNNAIMYK